MQSIVNWFGDDLSYLVLLLTLIPTIVEAFNNLRKHEERAALHWGVIIFIVLAFIGSVAAKNHEIIQHEKERLADSLQNVSVSDSLNLALQESRMGRKSDSANFMAVISNLDSARTRQIATLKKASDGLITQTEALNQITGGKAKAYLQFMKEIGPSRRDGPPEQSFRTMIINDGDYPLNNIFIQSTEMRPPPSGLPKDGIMKGYPPIEYLGFNIRRKSEQGSGIIYTMGQDITTFKMPTNDTIFRLYFEIALRNDEIIQHVFFKNLYANTQRAAWHVSTAAVSLAQNTVIYKHLDPEMVNEVGLDNLKKILFISDYLK